MALLGSLWAAALVGCGGTAFEGASVGLPAQGAVAGSGGSTVVGSGPTGSPSGAAGTMSVGGGGGSVENRDAGVAETIATEAAAMVPDAGPAPDTRPVCVPHNQCDGENCGDKDDGCGGHWHCGDCQGSEFCGASGRANLCATCPAGSTCSAACGACSNPTSCGAGADPNKCGYWTARCSSSPTGSTGELCVNVGNPSSGLPVARVYCPAALFDPAAHPECHGSSPCMACNYTGTW